MKGSEAERYDAELAREINREVREMVITWNDALADSEARGKLEGLRLALVGLLRRRFGLDAGEIEERLQAIESPAKLQELLDQAFDARSLDELRLAS